MSPINVYERYYAAEAEFNGVPRHGALVMLVADSDAGNIKYEAAVTFFPHNDEEDYAVSYDAYLSKVLYEAKGRRSKKREQAGQSWAGWPRHPFQAAPCRPPGGLRRAYPAGCRR